MAKPNNFWQAYIGLGEQSFKDADVLSEKNNFSAPGSPQSTIFDTVSFDHSVVVNLDTRRRHLHNV